MEEEDKGKRISIKGKYPSYRILIDGKPVQEILNPATKVTFKMEAGKQPELHIVVPVLADDVLDIDVENGKIEFDLPFLDKKEITISDENDGEVSVSD